MPNAESYNVDHVMKGPGKLWLNVGLPADGARLKIKANGAPDDTESSNAIFMGMTKSGCTYTETFTEEEEECDEFNGSYRDNITKEEGMIEGELLEFLDFLKQSKLQPNATFASGAASSGVKGYSQLKFGGKLTIVNMPMALITPRIDDPSLFTVVQLYAAHNAAGIKLAVTKKSSSSIPFKLVARVVPSRAKGDQLSTIWTEEAPALA